MSNFVKLIALLSASLIACGGDPTGLGPDEPNEPSEPGNPGNPGEPGDDDPNGDTHVVDSSSPATGDTGVGAGESFEVTLGETIASESGRVMLVGLSQRFETTTHYYARHPIQTNYDPATRKFSVTPLIPMEMGVTYRLVFEGFEDSAGNALETETIEVTTAKLIVTLSQKYLGSGNMYTYRTTSVEDGAPDTSLVYYGKGDDGDWHTKDDVLSSYHLHYSTFTTDNIAMFGNGDDDLWFTSDDEPFSIQHYKRLDDSARMLWVEDDPGVDGTWFTDDDQSDHYSVLSFNDDGLRDDIQGFETGPDKRPETDDDIQDRLTQFIYDDSWLIGMYAVYSGGDDSIFGTNDDSGYLRIIRRDDHGLIVRVDRFENVVRSNLALLTGNMQYTTQYTYDDFQMTEAIKLDDNGDDNQWLTDDDLAHYQEQYFYDDSGNMVRSMRIYAGEDGEMGTLDDHLGYYTDIEYDANGNQVARQSYSDFGDDGFPFTQDDVPSYDSEYLIVSD